MPERTRRSRLAFPTATVDAWLARAASAQRLATPWPAPAGIAARSETRDLDPDQEACWLTESVTWRHRCRGPGELIDGARLTRAIDRELAFRHRRIAEDLARLQPLPSLRVAVTGATGLVGSALCALLASGGHRVHRVVRRSPGPDDILWDPATATLDGALLDGTDAVVHLAGAPIAGRWTPARKQAIRTSRIDGTHLLATTLADLERPPPVLVSASALGFYGDRGDERVDEAAEPGAGFLADLAQAWEAAANPARAAGIRVVHPRIGIVLAGHGGMLPELLPMFRAGLGGPLGGGRQGVSWVHLDDLVATLLHLILHPIEGPVNAVGPAPVAQGDFAATLGRVVRRPALVPAPGLAVKAILGEAGQRLVLDGAFLEPAVLRRTGFRWRYPDLESALRWATGELTPRADPSVGPG